MKLSITVVLVVALWSVVQAAKPDDARLRGKLNGRSNGDLWEACKADTQYAYSDDHQDVTEEDCLTLPRWEGKSCIGTHVKTYCERRASADAQLSCKNARQSQLCCYRLGRCAELTNDGLDCAAYSGDLDQCLGDCDSVKDACRAECKETEPIGPARLSCKHVCRDAKFACQSRCKNCGRCATANAVCTTASAAPEIPAGDDTQDQAPAGDDTQALAPSVGEVIEAQAPAAGDDTQDKAPAGDDTQDQAQAAVEVNEAQAITITTPGPTDPQG